MSTQEKKQLSIFNDIDPKTIVRTSKRRSAVIIHPTKGKQFAEKIISEIAKQPQNQKETLKENLTNA